MTCIVGIEKDSKVYIGGDLQGSSPATLTNHTQPKVFRNNEIIFGFTGSYRFGQILEHHLDVPYIPENNDELFNWLVTQLIPNIRQILLEHGSTDGQTMNGSALIGVKNELWKLQPDFSILRDRGGYDAVGSGEEYAKGSLYALEKFDHQSLTVDFIMETAIHSAAAQCPSVGFDYTYIYTG